MCSTPSCSLDIARITAKIKMAYDCLYVCVSAFPFFMSSSECVCSVSTGNEMTGLVVSVETRERTP